MSSLCLSALRPLRRIFRSLRQKHKPPVLPNELWTEIFNALDNASLVAVSRVCREFNAHSLPIYLARHGISPAELRAGHLAIPESRDDRDVLPAVQTAFSLPPIRHLSCTIVGQRKLLVIRNLTRLIAQQRTLQEVHLTLYEEAFTAQGPKGKITSRRIVQRDICRMLNCITPQGKTLIIAADRLLVSGSARSKMWRVVKPTVAPPRGTRAKVRTAAVALKGRRSTKFDLVLCTVGEIRGTLRRESLILDALRSLHVAYAPLSGAWAVMVLDAASVTHLNLGSLIAEDWSQILPLLTLPSLVKFSMGRQTVYSATQLHDIATEELDPFLIRHPRIEHLEYFPQHPSLLNPVPPSQLSLPILSSLTSLTTTPAHFLRLHRWHAPNSFPTLTDLAFFAPTATLLTEATEAFTVVLRLLAHITPPEAATLRLRFPGVWIAPLPPGLAINCVASLFVFGGFPSDSVVLAAFMTPFESRLKSVELMPTRWTTFNHMRVVDELRRKLPWLERVALVRVDSGKEVVPSRRGMRPGLKYDD
ncbi:hypothetical protein C8F04DRAFT_495409 [Mycena alexandri]|uniref:F-box domain-containing protein n=1 Tax=Mycena alexandri TaxID=1745969 RepID=A0AAD6X5B4_9AGAR|nr:hypothetical protein C8F04DRAFT_495409 [Mycena alexandri]